MPFHSQNEVRVLGEMSEAVRNEYNSLPLPHCAKSLEQLESPCWVHGGGWFIYHDQFYMARRKPHEGSGTREVKFKLVS